MSRNDLRSHRRFAAAALVSGFLILLLSFHLAHAEKEAKGLTVQLPMSGDYLVWVEAETSSGPQAQAPVKVTGDRETVTLPSAPAGLTEWRVLALDEKSGYVASRSLPQKNPPAEVSLTTPDFNRVHRVKVQVTGAGDKPVASGSAMLTPAKASSLSRVIDPSAGGTAEFTDVPSGAAKLVVTTGGKITTKDVDINLAKGETVQTIAVPLPEVTAVVENPAGAASSPSGAGAKTGEGSSGGPPGGKPAGTETSPAPAAPPPSGGGFGNLFGLILIAAVIYGLYLYGKNQGWTLEKGLERLGVQPAPEVPAGSLPGRPPAPAPPPVDPNVCPFCGQRKDPATGACACSLDASAAAPFGAPGAVPTGSGPRLVAVSGVAMGQIFPIDGEATIGRDPGQSVSLSMDSTVSRSHAVIAAEGGAYVIRDQGSSNGTYVNGARVTEAPLRPGDEVSIGGTRFRFEA